MTAFSDLAKRRDVGCLFYFNVSRDGGATFDVEDIVSTHSLQIQQRARIVSLGNLTRALGSDYGFTAASIDLTLDNTDGALDWLVNPETYADNVIDSVWELVGLLWDPSNSTDWNSKVLGNFTILSPPSRTASTISVSLGDGGIGRITDFARAPSMRDWAAITDSSKPAGLVDILAGGVLTVQNGTIEGRDYDAPMPLIWGSDYFSLTRAYGICYPICAVPSVPGSLPTTAGVELFIDGINVPKTINTITVWTIRRTPTITVDGKSWHIMWLSLDIQGETHASATVPQSGTNKLRFFKDWFSVQKAGYSSVVQWGKSTAPWSDYDLLQTVQIKGTIGSRTSGTYSNVVVPQIAKDIATTCLPATWTVAGIDGVIASRQGFAGSGSVGAGTFAAFGESAKGGQSSTALTDVLRGLCTAGQFDLFFGWDGLLHATAPINDYTAQTQTFATLLDLDCAEISETIPSAGQRGAPFNVLWVTWKNGTRYGPFKTTAVWLKNIEKEINGYWLAGNYRPDPNRPRGAQNPTNLEYLSNSFDVTVRSRVTVVTGLNGLNYELGDYVEFTWVRGEIGGPYVSELFRVESVSLSPMDGKTQLELVWYGDLRSATVVPYILDNETLNIRVSASGGRTATLTNGSTTVTFSSGNLTSDGVAAGDILKVIDASESAEAFYRNRTLRIISKDSTTTVTVEASDFSTGGPFVITDWVIYRGQLTTARGAYYGKTCTIIGEFYNGDPVTTRLLDG